MNIRPYILIFNAEILFATKNLIRYPLNSLVSILLLSLLFITLHYSSMAMVSSGEPDSSKTAYNIAVFMAWALTITSLSSVANSVEEYAQRGVLEQLVVSGHRYEIVATIKSLVTGLIAILNNFLILIILSLFFKTTLPFNMNAIFWISMVLLSAIGVGLVIGAIAILTKQSSAITNLIQFLLLPLFFLQLTTIGDFDHSISWLVPTILPLKALLASISNIEHQDLIIASAISSVIWFTLGYSAIYLAVTKAKKKGLLQQS